MIWFLTILAVMHLIAAFSHIHVGHIGPYIMAGGSLLILYGSYISIQSSSIKLLPIIIGSILIIDSAIYNGYMQGSIHWRHHIIRAMLFVTPIVILYMKRK